MKKCMKCGFTTDEDFKYCPKCGETIKDSDIEYAGVFQSGKKKEEKKPVQNNFSFVVKLVVGILAMLSISFFKLGGVKCILIGMAGGICSISMCAWNNKLSGYIPAILFLLSCISAGKHPLTQMLCIIYIGLEIAAGIKIKK